MGNVLRRAHDQTEQTNGRQLEARNRSAGGEHFVQHVFASQGVSLVRR